MGDLARRERNESHGDASGYAMQAAFVVVLAGAAFDRRAGPAPAGGLQLAGLLLFAAALWLRHQTQRAMGSYFKVAVVLTDDQPLIRSGPFRWIRHPSYAAIGSIGIATAMLVESPLALAATVGVWLPAALIRIWLEEKTLARRFGADWTTYAAKTGRLLPRFAAESAT